MRPLLLTSIILTMTIFNSQNTQSQQLDFSKVKTAEHQLDDVMELIYTTQVKSKLKIVENDYKQNPNELNKVRLGLIYHETALNLTFLSKSTYKGYAKMSFDILSELYLDPNTTKEFLPFISSYRASALSLVGAETMKLGLIGKSFILFEDAVFKYAEISYTPEFLRGSVAENLPFFFFKKRRYAKIDMESIIEKQTKNRDYASKKIMSFTYLAWANQHKSKKYKTQAILYLDKAIALDPNYLGGRKKVEDLKFKLMKL